MAKTADELIAKLSQKRQERINKLTDELIAEEMDLREDGAKKKSAPHNQRPPSN